MFRRIRDFFNGLSDSQAAIVNIVWVVAVIAAGWATAIAWLKDHLSIASVIWYSIAVVCLILILVIAFITWWRKHDIVNIPVYLSRLDDIIKEYVTNYDTKQVNAADALAVAQDLGEYLNIDIWRLNQVVKEHKDKRILQEQFRDAARNVEKLIDPNKRSQDSLNLLLMISGIMNEHGVGLDTVVKTDNYLKVFNKVKSLQKVVPSAETNIRINEYFNWSTGLYSMILGRKFIADVPTLFKDMPVKERVTSTIFVPQVEANISTLLSAVHESIIKSQRRE